MILSYGQVIGKEHNAQEAYQWDKKFEEQLLGQSQGTKKELSALLWNNFSKCIVHIKSLWNILSEKEKII